MVGDELLWCQPVSPGRIGHLSEHPVWELVELFQELSDAQEVVWTEETPETEQTCTGNGYRPEFQALRLLGVNLQVSDLQVPVQNTTAPGA